MSDQHPPSPRPGEPPQGEPVPQPHQDPAHQNEGPQQGQGTHSQARPPQPGQALRPGPRPQDAVRPGPPPRPRRPDGVVLGNFKRGLGLGAGASLGIGTILLVLSIAWGLMMGAMFAGFAALAQGGGSQASAGTGPTETIWGAETAGHTLFAVPVSGPIMTSESDGGLALAATYGYQTADLIDSLTDEDADGLVLLMNTPGGTVTGAKAIADAVQRYQDRTGKKVFAHVQGMSASGGMYAMAGADEIQADYGTMIGSIGVIFGPFEQYTNVTAVDGGLLTGGVTAEKIEQFYLTQGTGKDVGNPFRAMTPDERRVLTEGMASEYRAFVQHVSEGRDIPVATITDQLGANLFSTEQAQANGLIDGVMGRDAAYRRAAELAGVDPADTRIVTPIPPDPLSQLLLGADATVPGQAAAAERAGDGRLVITSTLCTGRTTVLAFHGSLAQACGR